MLFNSLAFALFLPLVFTAYWSIVRERLRLQNLLLLAASYVFYGWWDWRFLSLIVISSAVDYVVGHRIADAQSELRRKILLTISLGVNLGFLGVFKYYDFFVTSMADLLESVGMQANPHTLGIILPVGISFYTFQSMSYTIDIYKGQLQPTRNPFHFFAYLSLFPQLVAGPIIRAADLLPQLEKESHTTEQERWDGLYLVVHGFAKKVLIADNLAYYVTEAFNNPIHSPNTLFWWVIMTAFAFQIYCDFSGYSDIARGLAKWLGYDFMVNFNHPYISTSLREFWTRWHISLSTWFRDYVYIPLGGSRCSTFKSEINMWITMLVSGFWHGAAWNFIIWGGLHAAGATVERFTRWPRRVMAWPAGRYIASALVLLQVWVTWVFFRANTLQQAVAVLHSMFSFRGGFTGLMYDLGGVQLLNIGVIVIIAALRELWFFMHWNEREFLPASIRPHVQTAAMAALIVACVFFRGPGSKFIYFQF